MSNNNLIVTRMYLLNVTLKLLIAEACLKYIDNIKISTKDSFFFSY